MLVTMATPISSHVKDKNSIFTTRDSLRSKCFRAVQEKRTRNESQRPRFISRAAKTENPVPRSFFAPKPNGNACYAGYARDEDMTF